MPSAFRPFIRQRLRWERDSLRLRLRKHRNTFEPWHRDFDVVELCQQLEFVVTNLIVTLAFPVYLVLLFREFGAAAWTVLAAVVVCYVLLDIVALCCALFIAEGPAQKPPLGAILIYGGFHAFVVRSIRLVAYVQEWVFETSRQDDYVPLKVRQQVTGR